MATCADQLFCSSLVTYQRRRNGLKVKWGYCWPGLVTVLEFMPRSAWFHGKPSYSSSVQSWANPLRFCLKDKSTLQGPVPCSGILFQVHTGPPSITMDKISLVASQMFRWFSPQIINPSLLPGTEPILLKPQLALGGNLTPVHIKVRKSSPCSEFATNPPKQAKWPWL